MAQKTILFISNGFAEDLVGAKLIQELCQIDPHLNFLAMPIVGIGEPYKNIGVELLGPHWELPSRGIAYGPEFNLKAELRAGAIKLYLGQIWSLIKNRRKIDFVVVVGDYLGTLISGLFVKKPVTYLWVTLSHFDDLVKYFLKKYVVMIFSRWKQWTHLPEFKVEWLGNPHMDTFEVTGDDFGLDRKLKTIGILPGSRQPAYNNLPVLKEIIQLISAKTKVNFVFALSPQINRAEFEKIDGVKLSYKFGDVLVVSDLVLGLAGTGNEQAAGLGKPIVTFWGGGASREELLVKGHAEAFLRGAAEVLPPEPNLVANCILSLLSDSARMEEMGRCGREINEGAGATKNIAERITQWLKSN